MIEKIFNKNYLYNQSDPFFQQNAAAFDERGIEGLMLNRLFQSSTEPFVNFLFESHSTGFVTEVPPEPTNPESCNTSSSQGSQVSFHFY